MEERRGRSFDIPSKVCSIRPGNQTGQSSIRFELGKNLPAENGRLDRSEKRLLNLKSVTYGSTRFWGASDIRR